MKYFPPEIVNREIFIKPPIKVVDMGAKIWDGALIGYLVGKSLPFGAVETNLEKKWQKYGKINIHTLDKGFFILKFEDSSMGAIIMEEGPWDLWGIHLALRKWERGLVPCCFCLDRVPIWLKKFNVPTESWTRDGMSYIANGLGTPICIDSSTKSKSKLNFARICVEIAVNSSFPLVVKLIRPYGTPVSVHIEHTWKPPICDVCKVFNHPTRSCRKSNDSGRLLKPKISKPANKADG
ncbi:DUF4283 domain-containing protein [Cephalotus follicularis]|uniref:DUF4283 domain-containing protein n=1 Tax=Cephalotus follicularis TaxID=3775 RepID=A0A1Q3B4G7_CEPFO|nr:DUF4283 domain-containing protein [Cephalotus follicularis]